MLDAERFRNLDFENNTTAVFSMVDMSDRIKSTGDLRLFLKLLKLLYAKR